MNSLILSTATRFLAPLIVLISIFVLLRGHNEPGGGFIGGLLGAIAFALIEKARGVAAARRAMRVDPMALAGVGLGCCLAGGLWGGAVYGDFPARGLAVLRGVRAADRVDPAVRRRGLPRGGGVRDGDPVLARGSGTRRRRAGGLTWRSCSRSSSGCWWRRAPT
jgi:hypothetical protein